MQFAHLNISFSKVWVEMEEKRKIVHIILILQPFLLKMAIASGRKDCYNQPTGRFDSASPPFFCTKFGKTCFCKGREGGGWMALTGKGAGWKYSFYSCRLSH